MTKGYRVEKDSIGEARVPACAYYGIQTMRAHQNFKITGQRVNPEFIRSIAEVKIAAAITNKEAGVLDEKIADAIIKAGNEVLNGAFFDDFIVDTIQGGAGTSLNMNANEVLANRAIEILGGKKGDYSIVHPNDHVNCGQSTNDVYPSAGKIAVIRHLLKAIKALSELKNALLRKSEEFKDIVKMGRTEMQDAVPVSLGQTFGAFAEAVSRDIKRFYGAIEVLSKLNMGGTAVGTGINADSVYISKIVDNISDITGLKLTQAENLIDATQNLDEFVYVSGILKSCAATISKISNDLRLMSSGPRTGFGEINLPARQNGSSIMPGKINPVMPEMINQISFNIIGNDLTITMAAEAGQLELNAFEPVIFYCFFESIEMLANGVNAFTEYCIKGITANEGQCRNEIENSLGLLTALCPYIGYTKASSLAKRALKEDKKVFELVLEEGIMTEEELDKVFDEVIQASC